MIYSGRARKLIMSDGIEYFGLGFGADSDSRVCEIVFNTSPVGYQEILSDPSYTDQFVVMAYPLIGNYGINDDDYETRRPTIGGFIVRDYNDCPSNFRSKASLSQVMKKLGIPGITGLDTREIVRKIRSQGTQKALITDAELPLEEGLRLLGETVLPTDAVSRVSRNYRENYIAMDAKYHIAAIDFGMKENIIRSFLKCGCSVTVYPWNVTADEVMRDRPDGIFLSNGGGNHPVKDLATGKIRITSQNHSYAVDESTLAGTGLTVTHRNILDGTVEGVRCARDRIFSVQYHPESAPGPHDSMYLFEEFLKLMEK